MRFSARLAGFCRGRCHQRRARRAELASFSILVSNLDFRVPRLRQKGERAADRAVQRRKRGRPRGPESRPGLPRRSRLARSGPGAARAWILRERRRRCLVSRSPWRPERAELRPDARHGSGTGVRARERGAGKRARASLAEQPQRFAPRPAVSWRSPNRPKRRSGQPPVSCGITERSLLCSIKSSLMRDFRARSPLPAARPAADLSQPCAPPGGPVARHPQPRSRKAALRREIPSILRGFQGRLSR